MQLLLVMLEIFSCLHEDVPVQYLPMLQLPSNHVVTALTFLWKENSAVMFCLWVQALAWGGDCVGSY